MASILEAQIDFLGDQVNSLPADGRRMGQIEEAMAVSLSLFHQIIASADRPAATSSKTLLEHWLRSAQTILPAVRGTQARRQSTVSD